MSKAKLVNECIKRVRQGVDLNLQAVPATPSSIPDNTAVGRFVTEDGGLHIASI